MAKSIMIQGTMSSVGKSLVAAGLCRLFYQDGFSVAPFKSQNMALNSFITKEGLEMGRAQVMQAEACKIEPSVTMNPILLKPTSDRCSQVIVNGEVKATMKAVDYFAYKKNLLPDIQSAYQKLCDAYDIVVIEGAGSPAEINLKENDIVNMGMARLANSPVLLVGDIDRGGVFAQLVGTLELLEKSERSFIKGFIINKFRGDIKLLESGIKMLEERTKIPVTGCIPFLNIILDDEDSLTDRFLNKNISKKSLVDIAVIRFPHISNFSDFTLLEANEFVNLHYVSSVSELDEADVIILPGTKNTILDLLWMRECGIEAFVKRKANEDLPIIGICGGYQMLGVCIDDKVFAECGKTVRGMELLPVKTEFTLQKTRTRVSATINAKGILSSLSECKIKGYEIHMGKTFSTSSNESHYFTHVIDDCNATEKEDGFQVGNIYGTYLHGFFDDANTVQKFVSILADKKGLHIDSKQKFKSYADLKDTQYNKLADALRVSLDIDSIYSFMGIK